MVAVQNDGPRRAEFHFPRRHKMDPHASELARIQRRVIHFVALFQIFVQSRHGVALLFAEVAVLFYILFCHVSMGTMRHEMIQYCRGGTDRHALNNDSARALHRRVEEAFAAEQHVLNSFDGTDFHGATLAHGR